MGGGWRSERGEVRAEKERNETLSAGSEQHTVYSVYIWVFAGCLSHLLYNLSKSALITSMEDILLYANYSTKPTQTLHTVEAKLIFFLPSWP